MRRVASIKKATNGECITLVNKVSENQSLINRLSGKENQMCRLLNSIGAKCFCATRAHLPKLFLHRLWKIVNIHAFLSFLVLNLKNSFYCKTQAAKIAYAHVEVNISLTLTYCKPSFLLLWSLYIVYRLKFTSSLTWIFLSPGFASRETNNGFSLKTFKRQTLSTRYKTKEAKQVVRIDKIHRHI